MEDDKVVEIFRRFVGDRAENLSGRFYPAYAISAIREALVEDWEIEGTDKIVEVDKIGQDLVDWQRNAAFLVALVLFPEEFNSEEIVEEVRRMILHIPDHIAGAKKKYDEITKFEDI